MRSETRLHLLPLQLRSHVWHVWLAPSSITDPEEGAWGAHALPFGTEQALNSEVNRALSARLLMNHGFLSCKHKTLESVAPWDSSVAVSTLFDESIFGPLSNLKTKKQHVSYRPRSYDVVTKESVNEATMHIVNLHQAPKKFRMAVPTPLYVCPPPPSSTLSSMQCY